MNQYGLILKVKVINDKVIIESCDEIQNSKSSNNPKYYL